MVDRLSLIAWRYVTAVNPLSTCFYFDAATSIPFSWIDWYIYEVRPPRDTTAVPLIVTWTKERAI